MGQILAGVILGPTVSGRLPGNLPGHLFPRTALPSLTALSQVAIVIFMFAVGYELDLRALPGRRRAGPLVAVGALLVPGPWVGSGGVLAATVRRRGAAAYRPALRAVHRRAVSITALPVLAAIVRERGIAGTTVGVTATTAAGILIGQRLFSVPVLMALTMTVLTAPLLSLTGLPAPSARPRQRKSVATAG